MRRLFNRALLLAVLPILLVEVPYGQLRRAWRNLHIRSEYRMDLRKWREYWDAQ